jgi:hypothetical protein
MLNHAGLMNVIMQNIGRWCFFDQDKATKCGWATQRVVS